MCYALSKPLIAVPTLLSLAEGIKQKVQSEKASFMPVMDARRMDIYTAVFDMAGNEVLKTTFATVNEELEKSVVAFGDVYIGGNATHKCRDVFKSPDIHFVEDIDGDSRFMANISEQKFRAGAFESVAYFESFYLKDFLPKKAI